MCNNNWMDKLSLESLFKCKTHNDIGRGGSEGGGLDVNTITRNQKVFDVNVLIETRVRRREKLLGYYEKSFEICVKKIEVANHLGKTDLLFIVREFVPNCPSYRSRNCVEYIRDRLQQKCFNIHVVDSKTLFITWLYLEVNTLENQLMMG